MIRIYKPFENILRKNDWKIDKIWEYWAYQIWKNIDKTKKIWHIETACFSNVDHKCVYAKSKVQNFTKGTKCGIAALQLVKFKMVELSWFIIKTKGFEVQNSSGLTETFHYLNNLI